MITLIVKNYYNLLKNKTKYKKFYYKNKIFYKKPIIKYLKK